jgi:hypothetical protein
MPSAMIHGIASGSLATTTAPSPANDICISDTCPDSPVSRTRLIANAAKTSALLPMSSW